MNILKKSIHIITKNYLKTCVSASACRFLNKQPSEEISEVKQLLEADKEYETFSSRYLGLPTFHNCFIIHPYVKWGPKKVRDSQPGKRLQEAVALIRTLDPWRVHDTVIVPLPSFHRATLFGKGTLERLRTQIRGNPNITAVFINVGRLKGTQLKELEMVFGVPILDRFKIIMQILKLHAIGTHAKLQVALAEIPYLRNRLKKDDFSIVTSDDYDIRRLMLQNREQKLKEAIEKLQSQRQLMRTRRKDLDYPIIAVVGYTNSGKTSLIKALTGDEKLQPRNELFATLDVTMHAGQLPSSLEVLYVDTVGFISDIPTTLIECFVVTLEDAMFADVIIHVEDLASEDLVHQRNHVLSTLQNLAEKTGCSQIFEKVITVGNKCDLALADSLSEDVIAVSATTHQGLDELRKRLEKMVLKATNRKYVTLKVPSGGTEMRWLYKNSAVTSVIENKEDACYQNMRVIITDSRLEQFKHNFVKKACV